MKNVQLSGEDAMTRQYCGKGEKIVPLSKRLLAIAELLADKGLSSFEETSETEEKQGKGAEFQKMADVGTDHGFLPIYLVQKNVCRKAIAMDLRKGPLMRAQEHVSEYKLEEKIETRLSDGLEALNPGEADAIVIAGMGGDTMEGILRRGDSVIGEETVLLLQPQSQLSDFRHFLWTRGYGFLKEDMVLEDGKFYFLMKVQKQAPEGYFLDSLEELYGPLLLKEKHPVLKEYLEWERKQFLQVLEGLECRIQEEQSSNSGEEKQDLKECAALDGRQEEKEILRKNRLIERREQLLVLLAQNREAVKRMGC